MASNYSDSLGVVGRDFGRRELNPKVAIRVNHAAPHRRAILIDVRLHLRIVKRACHYDKLIARAIKGIGAERDASVIVGVVPVATHAAHLYGAVQQALR